MEKLTYLLLGIVALEGYVHGQLHIVEENFKIEELNSDGRIEKTVRMTNSITDFYKKSFRRPRAMPWQRMEYREDPYALIPEDYQSDRFNVGNMLGKLIDTKPTFEELPAVVIVDAEPMRFENPAEFEFGNSFKPEPILTAVSEPDVVHIPDLSTKPTKIEEVKKLNMTMSADSNNTAVDEAFIDAIDNSLKNVNDEIFNAFKTMDDPDIDPVQMDCILGCEGEAFPTVDIF